MNKNGSNQEHDEWDAVVVGAGPAGAMASYCLAGFGVSVLLVDRSSFPRDKVCGGCLNLSAIDSLRRVGLDNKLSDLGAPALEKLRLAAYGEQIDVPLPGGYAVSRSAFDAMLVSQAEKKGVVFQPSTRAHLVSHEENDCLTKLHVLRPQKRQVLVRSKVVLAADGIGGSFLARKPSFLPSIRGNSRIGVGCLLRDPYCRIDPGEIQMAVTRNGYVGVVQVEDDKIDIAAAIDSSAIKDYAGSIGNAVASIREENGFPGWKNILSQAEWRGTPPLSRRRPRLGGTRLFIVGDAAGYVEPFTGEGMAWALLSGYLVAPLVRKAVQKWEPELEKAWESLYRQEVRPRQRICRLARWTLRRSLPFRLSLRFSGLTAIVARYLVRSINQSHNRKVLVT